MYEYLKRYMAGMPLNRTFSGFLFLNGRNMASPQLENGYTKIANELYDAIVKWHFSSYEYRVLIFIIRKTYGWGKKNDWISLSQFVVGTNIQRQHICRALKMLQNQNVITKGGNRLRPLYGVQKDYELWKLLPKGVRSHHLPKGVVSKGAIQVVSKGAHTKENITKENNIVDSPNGSPTVTNNSMYEELNDGEVVYDSEDNPKKKDTFGRFPARISIEYCKLTGNNKASAHLKAGKELMKLALQEYPEDSQEQHFEEIVSRMKIAQWHYENSGVKEWSLNKLVEKWDKILKEWYQEKLKYNK